MSMSQSNLSVNFSANPSTQIKCGQTQKALSLIESNHTEMKTLNQTCLIMRFNHRNKTCFVRAMPKWQLIWHQSAWCAATHPKTIFLMISHCNFPIIKYTVYCFSFSHNFYKYIIFPIATSVGSYSVFGWKYFWQWYIYMNYIEKSQHA